MKAGTGESQIVAIVGQTASGKSDLALDFAEALRGVIIGADAMQLYRGLDIGTAKTPVSERRGVPHFQLDVLDVDEDASVAAYQKHARADIEGLGGKLAVVTGGSGLYIRALLEPISFPGHDAAVRARLNEELESFGSAFLHERLRELDPLAGEMIHPNNGRRIVRALEVIEITGKPFTASLPGPHYFYPGTRQFGIAWPIEELEKRIAARSRIMFESGIIDEAELLEDLPITATAAKATGYKEALAVRHGEMTVDEAIWKVSLATRQLAMRQRKWFKRDPRIVWLDPKQDLMKQVLRALDFDDSKSFS